MKTLTSTMLSASLILLFTVKLLATDWYVDNTASGSNNGTSWANAWESLADISWGSISAGDNIYISGGSTFKTYAETLTPTCKGTAVNYITIIAGKQ